MAISPPRLRLSSTAPSWRGGRRWLPSFSKDEPYQKEQRHTPGLSGQLVIHFEIRGDGTVHAGRISTSSRSTLRNAAVEQCIKSSVNRLTFPVKVGLGPSSPEVGARVNYPFVFSPGS